eukprot:4755954-Pyramimonas_sp.AAC.1
MSIAAVVAKREFESSPIDDLMGAPHLVELLQSKWRPSGSGIEQPRGPQGLSKNHLLGEIQGGPRGNGSSGRPDGPKRGGASQ